MVQWVVEKSVKLAQSFHGSDGPAGRAGPQDSQSGPWGLAPAFRAQATLADESLSCPPRPRPAAQPGQQRLHPAVDLVCNRFAAATTAPAVARCLHSGAGRPRQSRPIAFRASGGYCRGRLPRARSDPSRISPPPPRPRLRHWVCGSSVSLRSAARAAPSGGSIDGDVGAAACDLQEDRRTRVPGAPAPPCSPRPRFATLVTP